MMIGNEADSTLELYTSMVQLADGTAEITGYAFGEPWVAQALMMDDIKFKTPEEAKAWWYKNYGRKNEQD